MGISIEAVSVLSSASVAIVSVTAAAWTSGSDRRHAGAVALAARRLDASSELMAAVTACERNRLSYSLAMRTEGRRPDNTSPSEEFLASVQRAADLLGRVETAVSMIRLVMPEEVVVVARKAAGRAMDTSPILDDDDPSGMTDLIDHMKGTEALLQHFQEAAVLLLHVDGSSRRRHPRWTR